MFESVVFEDLRLVTAVVAFDSSGVEFARWSQTALLFPRVVTFPCVYVVSPLAG